MSLWLCILVGVVLAFGLFWFLDDHSGIGSLIFMCLLFTFGVWMFFGKETETGREWRKENQEREAALARPHVIREADGCKTYRTKIDNQFHYYTRCENQTTHQYDRKVPCGKNCVRTETETITTDNK